MFQAHQKQTLFAYIMYLICKLTQKGTKTIAIFSNTKLPRTEFIKLAI